MKTVILGDIHGRRIWLDIFEKEKPERFVFVGDYFDSWNVPALDQLYNFQNILSFKKSGVCEVILLVGNHDFHYTPYLQGGPYSGYQSVHKHEIGSILIDSRNDLQMAYLLNDKFLISHAGVTNTWVYNNLSNPVFWGKIDEKINMAWLYKPGVFNFDGYDDYGDDITQSPIWVRPNSLFKDRYKTDTEDYHQIVGHTRAKQINHPTAGNKLYFVDTLDNKLTEYLVIDEENNVIINNIKSPKKE